MSEPRKTHKLSMMSKRPSESDSTQRYARLLRGLKYMDESEICYEIIASFIEEKSACEVEEAYMLSVMRDLMRCIG